MSRPARVYDRLRDDNGDELLLADLWPDPDRRDYALLRLAYRVAMQPGPGEPTPERDRLGVTPTQARMLEGLSHGLGREGTAELCGVTLESVKTQLQLVRRTLGAKDSTHAVAIALRHGIIR